MPVLLMVRCLHFHFRAASCGCEGRQAPKDDETHTTLQVLPLPWLSPIRNQRLDLPLQPAARNRRLRQSHRRLLSSADLLTICGYSAEADIPVAAPPQAAPASKTRQGPRNTIAATAPERSLRGGRLLVLRIPLLSERRFHDESRGDLQSVWHDHRLGWIPHAKWGTPCAVCPSVSGYGTHA